MLSLSMIVKDEEEYIKDCLLSVKDVVDEIVVVDTGSSDRTKEIAKEFGAKIFDFTWVNDFSAARNFALTKTKSGWILYLDADERLGENSKPELKNLTLQNVKKAYLCRVNSIDKINNRPSIMDYVRLFPKDEHVRFKGKIHEQIEESLLNEKYSIEKSGIEIIHLGYNVPEENLKIKAERNLHLLLGEYNNNPDSYYAFQLGQTYAKLNDKIKAEKYFLSALNDSSLIMEYQSLANRYLAVNSAERHEWEKALSYIDASLTADATQPVALMVASKIYGYIGRVPEALEFSKKAFKMNEEYSCGKISSHQTILVDTQSIIEEGINLSTKSSDKESFEFFFDKIKMMEAGAKEKGLILKLNLYHKLFENKIITEEEIENYVQTMENNDVNVLLFLLDNFSDLHSKIFLLSQVNSKFRGNYRLLKSLSRYYNLNEDSLTAEKLMEESFSISSTDPSAIFYLISLYVKNQHFSKIEPLIITGEQNYRNQPPVLEKLEILKDKLAQFMS